MNPKKVRFLQIYFAIIALIVVGPPLSHNVSVSKPQKTKNQRLFTAILNNDTPEVHAAIRDGADINTEMEGWSWTDFVHPLTNAVSRDMKMHLRDTPLLATLDSLVKRPASVAPDRIPPQNMEMVSALVRAGADVNARNNIGLTALNLSVQWQYWPTMTYLLQQHADPNIADSGGSTPLHNAASSGQINVVRELLAAGANPNNKDVLGYTPLEQLVVIGSDTPEELKIIRLLVTKGTNLNIRDNDNFTALARAQQRHHKNTAALLQGLGAK